MHLPRADNLAPWQRQVPICIGIGTPSAGECAELASSASPAISILRVFPRRTAATPCDELAFVGNPPLLRPPADEVHVSCTFTWDRGEAERLVREWRRFYENVKLGGPAYDDPGNEFVPGRYLKPGYLMTSRGCPNRCDYCLVPKREGPLRTLPIHDGHDILDNNLLACPRNHLNSVLAMLARQRRPARFTGGLEARLIGPWFAYVLATMRLDVAYLAYDRPGDLEHIAHVVARIQATAKWKPGTLRRKLACYILIGWRDDTTLAAIDRLSAIKDLGITPFPMIYEASDGDHQVAMTMKRRLRSWMRPSRIYSSPAGH